MRTTIQLLLAALMTACTITPSPTPPEPTPTPPGPIPAPDGGLPPTCGGACERARTLGCSWGLPTAAGTPCETVCADTVASGLVALDLACLARMARCEDEPTCSRAVP